MAVVAGHAQGNNRRTHLATWTMAYPKSFGTIAADLSHRVTAKEDSYLGDYVVTAGTTRRVVPEYLQ